MKLIFFPLILLIANTSFANYRCDTINNQIKLLNSEGTVLKTWNNLKDYRTCVKHISNSSQGEFRCDSAGDNDTAVLYNEKNIAQQSWDREFGLEKDMDHCRRTLSLNYTLGAFRCEQDPNKVSKVVKLKNANNVVQKVFSDTEDNMNACRDHIRPQIL